MRYVFPSIEQLDLAAAQLQHPEHSSFARFALILTDNIVELMLHKQCEIEFLDEEFLERIGKQKYSPKQKAEALGQHFDNKLKFCRRVGKLSTSEQDFIHIAHKYRGELYHSGIKYDDMIYDLAWHYHELACQLFGRLRPMTYCLSSRDNPSDVVKKYIEHATGSFLLSVDPRMNAISCGLARSKPPIQRSLQDSLSASAIARVELVQDQLDFLVSDNPAKKSERAMLEHIQFFDFFQNDEATLANLKVLRGTPRSYWRYVEEVRKKWTPRHRINPLPRYMLRAKSLAAEKDSTNALKKFERLREDMGYIAKLVEEAASSLDAHIQSEIDRARGK